MSPDSSYPPRQELPLPTKPPYIAFVGNLSFDIYEDAIAEFFAPVAVKEIKIIKDQSDMTALEAMKLAGVAATYEAQIETLHEELVAAQQTVSALDEQKQENMYLKETIDRMRYDMDEMRTSSVGGSTSGAASVRGSVSKRLGAELIMTVI